MRDKVRSSLPPAVAIVLFALLTSIPDVSIVRSLVASSVGGAVTFWLMYALNSNPYADELDKQDSLN